MSRESIVRAAAQLSTAGALALALGVILPAPASAQDAGSAAPGRRRCPTCAPAPARSARAANNAPGRTGGDHTPSTDASITLGKARYEARVDANCELRERAPVGGPRMYYLVMYPWFGRRVGPDEAKWRFDLEILRGPTPGVHRHFVFSFQDGTRSGTIQVLPGAERYGSGTVRVTRHAQGARFEVQGVSEKGVPLSAILDCPAFESSEAAGG